MAVEKVEGVREATFSYAMGDGFVMYDQTKTSPDDIIAELQRVTAYTATVREVAGDHEAGADDHDADAGDHDEEDGNKP